MSLPSPRIILWDIETSHNLVAVFRLAQNDYIQPDNIVQERIIVCAAWKVLGEREVHAVSLLDVPDMDDHYICKVLHEVLSGADIIVAHNGDAYDIKFTEARMLHHGLSPLPPITKIDTLKVARDRFLFNANNLDYLGKFLGVGRKKPTTTGLWLKVLKGDPKAIEQMVSYNKQDVRLLERVFKKLRPYIKDHPNLALYRGEDGSCPRCGKRKLTKNGSRIALTQRYIRYQCQACGGWCRDRKSIQTTAKRVL